MAKILVVEDEPANIEILERLLTLKKHEFQVATNRADAVTKAVDFQPELVLMDIKIPDVDGGGINSTGGLEAMRELRSNPSTCGVAIIATSASDLPEDRTRFREAGANDIVSKPFVDFQILLDAITRNVETPV